MMHRFFQPLKAVAREATAFSAVAGAGYLTNATMVHIFNGIKSCVRTYSDADWDVTPTPTCQPVMIRTSRPSK